MTRVINPRMVYPVSGQTILEAREAFNSLRQSNEALAHSLRELSEKYEAALQEDALEDAEYEARINELREKLSILEEQTLTVTDILGSGENSEEDNMSQDEITVDEIVPPPFVGPL